MSQALYEQWILGTSVAQLDQLAGGQHISESEMYFINKYAKTSILDIGCGTGHRTFPIWINKKLNFYGIEKYSKLIEGSRFKDKIIQGDISSPKFKELLQNLPTEHFDIAFLLGGVINGIFDKDAHKKTWANFRFLLGYCDYILIDTLTHFSWFANAKTGQEIQLFAAVPPHFYSRKELESLNDEFGLKICEERTERLLGFQRTLFLLNKEIN